MDFLQGQIKMEAKETNFLKFLNSPKQLIIPIYQRTYSWKLKECEQLWKDIIRVGNDEDISGHFVGSIVYVEKGLYQVSALPRLLVIDGQQRLTTLSLLLSALCNHIIEKNIPVVLVSRCSAGETLDIYGYPGAGKWLKKMGVIFADYLNGQKARIKLIVCLGLTKDKEKLRRMFEK